MGFDVESARALLVNPQPAPQPQPVQPQAQPQETAGFDIDAARELVAKEAQRTQPPSQGPLPEGGVLGYLTAPSEAIIKGLSGLIISGYGGASTAVTDGLEAGVRDIERIQSAYAPDAPETQQEKAGLDAIQYLSELAVSAPAGLAGIVEFIKSGDLDSAVSLMDEIKDKGAMNLAGDKVFEVTGSPLLSAATVASPELAGLVAVGSAPVRRMSRFQREMGEKLRNRSTENVTAKYQLMNVGGRTAGQQSSGAGMPAVVEQEALKDSPMLSRMPDVDPVLGTQGAPDAIDALAKRLGIGFEYVRKDPLFNSLSEQGWDQGVLAAIKAGSPEDKKRMLKMLQMKQATLKNKKLEYMVRPTNIAGDSLLERVEHVRKVNQDVGKLFNQVIPKLKGARVDTESVGRAFFDDLDAVGISLRKNEAGELELDFGNSVVRDVPAARNAINKVFGWLVDRQFGTTTDAFEVHRAKKYIDEVVTYGKEKDGLAGETERILKRLRAGLNETLNDNFDDYRMINKVYSDTITTLDDIQDVMGKKIDLLSPNANTALGTRLRTLVSNQQGRAAMIDAINQLETVARRYGGEYNDDVLTQMLFADELDVVLGGAPRNALSGEMLKAVKRGIEEAAGGKGVIRGLAGKVVGKLTNKEISNEKAIELMSELLKRDLEVNP